MKSINAIRVSLRPISSSTLCSILKFLSFHSHVLSVKSYRYRYYRCYYFAMRNTPRVILVSITSRIKSEKKGYLFQTIQRERLSNPIYFLAPVCWHPLVSFFLFSFIPTIKCSPRKVSHVTRVPITSGIKSCEEGYLLRAIARAMIHPHLTRRPIFIPLPR